MKYTVNNIIDIFKSEKEKIYFILNDKGFFLKHLNMKVYFVLPLMFDTQEPVKIMPKNIFLNKKQKIKLKNIIKNLEVLKSYEKINQ